MTGADRLKTTLAALPGALRTRLPGALEAMAATAAAGARARLRAGPLADSIAVTTDDTGAGILTAGAPQAVFVEYGTTTHPARPFLRPAAEAAAVEGRAALADAFAQAVTETLDRSA